MTQEEIWIPSRHVSVFFGIASAFIETSADPSWDLLGGFLLPVGFCFLALSPGRIGSLLGGTDPAVEIGRPLYRQVLVGEKRFFLLPVPAVCPQDLIHKIAEEQEVAGFSRQLGLPIIDRS